MYIYSCSNSLLAQLVKNLLANAGNTRDVGLIPGSGRSPGEGNDNPLQYSCLENSMGRGAWQAKVYRVTKNLTRLSTRVHTHNQFTGKYPTTQTHNFAYFSYNSKILCLYKFILLILINICMTVVKIWVAKMAFWVPGFLKWE